MTWKQLTERDYREWELSAIDPRHRYTWRSGVRSAMSAASQLSGRGPTDMVLPLIKNPMMMINAYIFAEKMRVAFAFPKVN